MKYPTEKIRALRGGLITAAAATAAALIFTGCLFDPPPDVPPQQPVKMTSPVNVLKNIEIAYNQRNIDLYKRALSPNFVFYFDPRDVGESPPGKTYIIPESWSYTEDWQATNNMFNKAYSINLKISTGKVGEPEAEENTYEAQNIDISLLVMIDELNGFISDQGYCNFEFEKYKNEESQDRWRLTKWWDRTSLIPS